MRAVLLLLAALLAAPAVAGPPAAAQAPAVVDVPASIDATGATDVTAALNELIASAPDGATIRFRPGAVHRVEGVLEVVGRRDLTFEFQGATLVRRTDGREVPPPRRFRHRWPRHRPVLYVRESARVTIRDLNVHGPHEQGGTSEEAYVSDLEAQHAIELAAVRGALVEGGELSHVHGDGVTIAEGSREVVVRGVYVHHNGRQGIAVTGAVDVTLVGNRLDQIRRAVFDVEPDGRAEIRSVRIVGNRVGRGRLLFVAAAGSSRGPFDDLLIQGNHLTGMPIGIVAKAPDGHRRSNVRIVGNRSEVEAASPVATIRVIGFDHVLVAGNHQPVDRPGFAVETQRSCGVVVRDNAFPGAELHHVDDGHADCAHLASVPRVDDTLPAGGQASGPPTTASPRASTTASTAASTASTTPPSTSEAAAPAGRRGGGDDPGHPLLWFGAGAASTGAVALALSARRRRRPGAGASTPPGAPR